MTWIAIVTDADGFVLTDEDLRGWAAAVNMGKTGWGIPCEPPTAVCVVTGSALPKPQFEGSETLRSPGSYYTSDVLFEIDVEEQEPDDIIQTWERAQACAAGLNERNIP